MAENPRLKWLPALLWFGVVAYFSLLPKVDVPELLTTINDKAIHLGIYFIGTLFLRRPVKRHWFLWLLGVWLFGAAIEWIQAHFIPGRTGDFADLLANATGIVLAALLVSIRKQ